MSLFSLPLRLKKDSSQVLASGGRRTFYRALTLRTQPAEARGKGASGAACGWGAGSVTARLWRGELGRRVLGRSLSGQGRRLSRLAAEGEAWRRGKASFSRSRLFWVPPHFLELRSDWLWKPYQRLGVAAVTHLVLGRSARR